MYWLRFFHPLSSLESGLGLPGKGERWVKHGLPCLPLPLVAVPDSGPKRSSPPGRATFCEDGEGWGSLSPPFLLNLGEEVNPIVALKALLNVYLEFNLS